MNIEENFNSKPTHQSQFRIENDRLSYMPLYPLDIDLTSHSNSMMLPEETENVFS